MATVKRQVTESQRETVNTIPLDNEGFVDDYEDEVAGIQVPSFLQKSDYEVPNENEEKIMSTLNNVPGNKDMEEKRNLEKMEQMSANYRDEEWKKIIINAPSEIMTSELQRRLKGFEEYRSALKGADEVMERLNL